MTMCTRGRIAAAGFCAALLAFSSSAVAATGYGEKVLKAFETSDGLEPLLGNVVLDTVGDVYGTTQEGGADNRGVVYKVDAADGSYHMLYSFTGGTSDGGPPVGTLLIDGSGNIIGASTAVIWKLTNNGGDNYSFSVLYSFLNKGAPNAGVIADNKGNFYGTDGNTIYELTAKGKYKALYTLNGGSDGSIPTGELVRDKTGNLYGVASIGGDTTNCYYGCGTVFELAAGGSFSVLCTFPGGDGVNSFGAANPIGGLTMDKGGNLYGTTTVGGLAGEGTIYEITSAGSCNSLYSFGGTAKHPIVDGGNPEDTLVWKSGILYGTTVGDGANGWGTVFSFKPGAKHDTMLYAFCPGFAGECSDGANPYSGLAMDPAGNLYGATATGGDVNPSGPCGNSGCGTVFELTKQ